MDYVDTDCKNKIIQAFLENCERERVEKEKKDKAINEYKGNLRKSAKRMLQEFCDNVKIGVFDFDIKLDFPDTPCNYTSATIKNRELYDDELQRLDLTIFYSTIKKSIPSCYDLGILLFEKDRKVKITLTSNSNKK